MDRKRVGAAALSVQTSFKGPPSGNATPISVSATRGPGKNAGSSEESLIQEHQAGKALRPFQDKIDRLPGFTSKSSENLARDLSVEDKVGPFIVALALSSKNPISKLERHIIAAQRTVAYMALAERLEQAPPAMFTAEIRGDNHPKEGAHLQPAGAAMMLQPSRDERRRLCTGGSGDATQRPETRDGGRNNRRVRIGSPPGGRGGAAAAAAAAGGGGGGGASKHTHHRLPPPHLDLPPDTLAEAMAKEQMKKSRRMSSIEQLAEKSRIKRRGLQDPTHTPAFSRISSEEANDLMKGAPGDVLNAQEFERSFHTSKTKFVSKNHHGVAAHLGVSKIKVSAAGITLGEFRDDDERVDCFMVKQDDGTLPRGFMLKLKGTRLKLHTSCARGSEPTPEFVDAFDRINPKTYAEKKEKKALLEGLVKGSIAQRDARLEEEASHSSAGARPSLLIMLSDVQAAIKALR